MILSFQSRQWINPPIGRPRIETIWIDVWTDVGSAGNQPFRPALGVQLILKRHITLALAAALLTGSAALAQSPNFASVMADAMQRMHAAMMVPSAGDPDRDFAAMMIPHHQGAIEMAEAELRFGKDERLRRLAQGIIVEQRQEIAVMQAILTEKGGIPAAPHAHHPEGSPQ